MAGATAGVHGRRSPWWAVGYAAALGGAAVSATVGSMRPLDSGFTLLTVALVVSAACLWWVDGSTPRRVGADAEGLVLESPRRSRTYRWDEVRRVRGQGGLGTPELDTALELRGGRLVGLPPGTPRGTVETWRDGLGGGAAPPAELPQRWEVPDHGFGWPYWAGVAGGNLLGPPLARGFDLGDLGLAAVYLLLVVGLVLLARFVVPRHKPRQVVASATGVRFGRGGRRHVPWSDVAEVRPLNRYEPVTVLERTDGDVVQLPGPPPEVVQQWRQLSRPA